MEAFDRLVHTETVLWNILEERLLSEGRAGLGTLQALRALKRHDGRGRVEDLRRELSITNGAASKLVDRMQRAGLVSRAANPSDRRSSLVALTDAGQSEVDAGEVIVRDLVGRAIGDDAVALLTVIERIDERIAELADRAS